MASTHNLGFVVENQSNRSNAAFDFVERFSQGVNPCSKHPDWLSSQTVPVLNDLQANQIDKFRSRGLSLDGVTTQYSIMTNDNNHSEVNRVSRISRRAFVASATAATLGSALDSVSAQDAATEKTLARELPPAVQMQFMRPAQLEKVIRSFPVAYVPFGLIEWHGRHLPLGNDALKAHAILVKTAEQFGGVVYPPIYFHDGFPQQSLVPVLTELFQRLKKTGFRVILGVSGHNVQGQIDMINKALAPVVADGTVAGIGLWEVTLSQGAESNTDHAAKWETSNMMFFYPELVDMAALGNGPLAPNMKAPDGIGGLDPRKHASVEIGRRNVELAAEAIGRKARSLLETLPETSRSSQSKSISPGNWWMI